MDNKKKPIAEDAQITVSSDVIYQELDGEMVILDMKSGEYFGIDEIGSRIWALLEQGKTANAMYGALMEEYEVDEATCRQHVMEFLGELTQAGLVEVQ